MDRDRLDELANDIAAFADTLTAGIANLDFAGRQRLVRLLVERVVVKDDVVTMSVIFRPTRLLKATLRTPSFLILARLSRDAKPPSKLT